LSDQLESIKLKPSFVPYIWKGLTTLVIGLVLYVALAVIPLPLLGFQALAIYAVLAIIGLGLLGTLVGSVRRNMFTYVINERDIVVQKQLLRRSVRRIPLSSISDVEVSQTFVGRLAGYGNIAPVTKSGYGLVRGIDRSENVVQEMINVPKPDKVADEIMRRVSTMAPVSTSA
jgi:membrane protein YdbS with pleckstrin-like domain